MPPSPEVARYIWIFLVGAVVVYGIAAYFIVYRFLQPAARRLFIIFIAVETILLIAHAIWAKDRTTFLGWFVNLDREMTAGAVFSTAQYSALAVTAGMLAAGLQNTKVPQRIYWGLLALVFVWLSFDEFFSLHETFQQWRSAYTLSGLGVVVLTGLVFAIWNRDSPQVFVPLIFGLVLMGSSGVFLDVVTNDHIYYVAGREVTFLRWFSCNADWWTFVRCRDMNHFGFVEEFFEMAGASAVLAASISYLQSTRENLGRWVLSWAVPAFTAVWFGVIFIRFWGGPAVGLIGAQREYASYGSETVELLGYRLSKAPAYPDDSLRLRLYFRLNELVQSDYMVSSHLETRLSSESVAQADSELGDWLYPTSAWIPGIPVTTTLTLTVPEDKPTPQSYWLTVSVWHLDEEQDIFLSSTDLQRLNEHTVVLTHLSVLSSEAPSAPPVEATYTFPEDGLTLAGYEIPDTVSPGEDFRLKFWWQAEDYSRAELQQFVHFLQQEEGEGLATHDQSPFGGDGFPTSGWPGGMYEQATMVITLPDDLPPGMYDVYTGLYTSADVVRRPVVDEQGQSVLNNAIRLGTVRIKP